MNTENCISSAMTTEVEKQLTNEVAVQSLKNLKKKSKRTFPKKVSNLLKSWLYQHIEHPYPSETLKRQFSDETGLTLLQVNNWFINARRRIIQPLYEDQTVRNRSLSRLSLSGNDLSSYGMNDSASPSQFNSLALSSYTQPSSISGSYCDLVADPNGNDLLVDDDSRKTFSRNFNFETTDASCIDQICDMNKNNGSFSPFALQNDINGNTIFNSFPFHRHDRAINPATYLQMQPTGGMSNFVTPDDSSRTQYVYSNQHLYNTPYHLAPCNGGLNGYAKMRIPTDHYQQLNNFIPGYYQRNDLPISPQQVLGYNAGCWTPDGISQCYSPVVSSSNQLHSSFPSLNGQSLTSLNQWKSVSKPGIPQTHNQGQMTIKEQIDPEVYTGNIKNRAVYNPNGNNAGQFPTSTASYETKVEKNYQNGNLILPFGYQPNLG